MVLKQLLHKFESNMWFFNDFLYENETVKQYITIIKNIEVESNFKAEEDIVCI